MHRLTLAFLMSLMIAGCGSGPAPSTGLGYRNRTILTLEEIRESRTSETNAFEVIKKMRPEYLRSRGSSSLQNTVPVTAVVYVDDFRYGALDTLRTVAADHIFQVTYLNSSDATTRFGTDHLGGAILITTR